MKEAQQVAAIARELMLAIERDEHGSPITLEGAIRAVILKSPDMIAYRDEALNTLYCVLGAGIEWDRKTGRLTDNCPNNYMNIPPDTYYGPWSDHGREESWADLLSGLSDESAISFGESLEASERRDLDKAIATIENIDERCATYRTKKMSWYPLSWYANRLCVPENAQLDWLDGAIETSSLIASLEPSLVFPVGGVSYSSQLQTQRLAMKILPILKQRMEILQEKHE